MGEVGASKSTSYTITVDCVSVLGGRLLIKLLTYKFSSTPKTILISPKGGEVCPVQLVRDYMGVRPVHSKFFFVDKMAGLLADL